LDEEQSKEVTIDTNNFIKKQLSSTPFHVRFGLTLVGVLFLCLIIIKKSAQSFKKEKNSDGSIILSIISMNKYLSSFARIYRSLTVLAFYEHPEVTGIIDPQHGVTGTSD